MSAREHPPVGVVGAGVMGAGLSQALSDSGIPVVLVDRSQDALDHALAEVRRGLMGAAMMKRRRSQDRLEVVLGRIKPDTSLDALAECAFVVENITESIALKEELYPRLDRILGPAAVIAANTSAVSISRLGACSGRPDRVVGMHFMNPVPLKPAVEVIRGELTSEETLARALALLAEMGKEGIVVGDSPGFVSNRVLMLTVNEAIRVVEEGVARTEDVDRIFTQCFGHPMGPLATADLIGLDTILLSLEVLQEQTGEARFAPCALLRRLVEEGKLGRKRGEGFFSYARAGAAPPGR